jgi:hypothetical protein
MSKLRAVMLALIGILALGYVGKSVSSGVINAGGRSRDFFVAFAESPGLFVFAAVVIALIGVGALAIAWRALTGKSED